MTMKLYAKSDIASKLEENLKALGFEAGTVVSQSKTILIIHQSANGVSQTFQITVEDAPSKIVRRR